MKIKDKKLKIFGLFLGLIVAILGFFNYQFTPDPDPEFGVTYSHRSAQYLGFDPKTAYLDILNDLKPKKMRLMAYWEDIEPQRGTFNYQQIDEYLIEAGKRDVEVLLVVGHKQPRWPECHHPQWYEELSPQEKEDALFNMLRNAVSHFRQFDAVKMWQVENEPYFVFGWDCPQIPEDLIKREIQVVRELDSRPVVLTDSGELGSNWRAVAALDGDILGSTMYRTVYNNRLGYNKYPLPPMYYRIKAGVLKAFGSKDSIIGVELQAEPWFTRDINETPVTEQLTLMNPKVFLENVNYANKVGFSENYLWGVEWWYWLAKKQNDWGMWNAAKQVISSN